ncbi:MAG: hypothetical protein H6658_02765 [Ardenticatenaceae bacterium]|nr:hypothetical protein [Ardenticatenaceae bacterium]
MGNQSQIVRDAEQNILDKEHNRFMLLRRPEEQAIFYLLKVFGGFILLNDQEADNGSMSIISTHATRLAECRGLDFCLMWLAKQPSYRILLPDVAPKQMVREALELFSWGMDYAKLTLDHMAWDGGRGPVHVEVDENNRIFTFKYPSSLNSFFWRTQVVSEGVYLENKLENISLDELKIGFSTWRDNLSLQSGNSLHQKIINQLANEIVWPSVPPETRVGAYTLNDFRHCFAALLLNGVYSRWAEQARGTTEPIIVTYPSKQEMASWLCEISNISFVSASTILDDLLFDPDSVFRSSIREKPFVRAHNGNGQLFLLTSYIPMLDPELILARILTKDSDRKSIYDEINTGLEQCFLDEVETAFQSLDVILEREPRLTNGNGQSKSPDFLLIDQNTRGVFVIDCKYSLPPLTPKEVINKMKELTEGTEQTKKVHEYMKFITEDKSILSKWLEKIETVYGLLLFRWSMPLPAEPSVSVSNWASFQKMLSQSKNVSFSDVLHWLITRPDLNIDTKGVEWYQEIQVGDWTYRSVMENGK